MALPARLGNIQIVTPAAGDLIPIIPISGTSVNGDQTFAQASAVAGLATGAVVSALAVTSDASGLMSPVLPARSFILYALLTEDGGHDAVVGIGTSQGASDVVSGLSVPANKGLMVTSLSFNGTDRSTSPRTLWISGVSGGASVSCFLFFVLGP